MLPSKFVRDTFFLTLMCLVPFFAACERHAAQTVPNPSPMQMTLQPAITPGSAENGPAPNNPAAIAKPTKPVSMTDLDQLARSILNAKTESGAIVAEDFSGGRGLSPGDVSDSDVAAALKTARQAFDALKSGTLPETLFDTEVKAMLRPDIEEIAKALSRLTTLRFLSTHVAEPGLASFRVHIIGQDLSAYAEIQLRKRSDWFVADVQLDIDALSNMTVPDYNNYTPQDGERRMIREGNAGSWP